MGSVKRIVIGGGGVIGAAIAYFSSRRGARPIVIERHEVAGAASGKSGAFLALSRNGGRGAPPRHRRGPDMRSERSRARRRAREPSTQDSADNLPLNFARIEVWARMKSMCRKITAVRHPRA
jgi:glycine/D-amino acid oxidase-like deaminating enzyme